MDNLITGIRINGRRPQGEGAKKVLKLLNTMFSVKLSAEEKKRIMQDEFNIPITESLSKEIDEMSSLGEALAAKSYGEGFKQGHSEGITFALRNLMASTGWDINRAMEALGIPQDERPNYRAKIMN